MKVHLLRADKDFDFGAEPPARQRDLVQDLELPVLLSAMAGGDAFLFDVSARVLLASLTDPDEISYRQRVLADCIAQPGAVRALYSVAVNAIEDRRHIWGIHNLDNPSAILSSALRQLEAAIVRVRELRRLADLHAGAFASEGFATLIASLQRELDDDYLNAADHHLEQLRFRRGELLSARLGADSSGVGYVLRVPRRRRHDLQRLVELASPKSYSFKVPPHPDGPGRELSDIANRGLARVANAAAQSADHISSYFTALRAELAFYLGGVNLYEALTGIGEAVTFPTATSLGSGELSAHDLRDTCLALRGAGRVIGNDLDADDKALVLVTGANSGGKSTFLRSLGVAQLMMQCGLFVTAGHFRSSVARQVFTHFIREEDRTMTRGRLDDELARMSAIAEEVSWGCLILFNESFAGTNEREGSEIACQVVRALLDGGVRVAFVTHLFDFAHSLYLERAERGVFLRAERHRSGQRGYKLTPGEPLATSFAEDVYLRVGRWMDGEPTIETAPHDRGQLATDGLPSRS
ncbi:MAG TPA: hypothetical protein VMD59_17265 [Acidimicrobiales bacterium]|nr:hypothetical protein [Acidimicrobiales bacterium]